MSLGELSQLAFALLPRIRQPFAGFTQNCSAFFSVHVRHHVTIVDVCNSRRDAGEGRIASEPDNDQAALAADMTGAATTFGVPGVPMFAGLKSSR